MQTERFPGPTDELATLLASAARPRDPDLELRAELEAERENGAFRIPDFRADEATLSEFDESMKAAVARTMEQALVAIREAHATRRRQLLEDVEAIRAQLSDAIIASMLASDRYSKLIKRRKRPGRLSRPTFAEQLRTLGRAGRYHRSAIAAEKGSASVQARLREAESNVDKHDRRLESQIEARELELRRYYNGAEGRAALEREPYLRQLFKHVKAIRAERERYGVRFAAGQVSPDEQRIREMARDRYVFLDGDISGAYFLGQVAYGRYRYAILRDRDGRDWLLDADDRYRRMEKMVLDIRRAGDGSYVVRKATGPDPRIAGLLNPIGPDPRRPAPAVDAKLVEALLRFTETIY